MLFWALPLFKTTFQGLDSFNETVYNSIITYFQSIKKESSKRFLILSYKTEIEDSVQMTHFKYKIDNGKEICNRNKLYPENFDCYSRCSEDESLYKGSLVEFLSFSVFKSQGNSTQSNLIYKLFQSEKACPSNLYSN